MPCMRSGELEARRMERAGVNYSSRTTFPSLNSGTYIHHRPSLSVTRIACGMVVRLIAAMLQGLEGERAPVEIGILRPILRFQFLEAASDPDRHVLPLRPFGEWSVPHSVGRSSSEAQKRPIAWITHFVRVPRPSAFALRRVLSLGQPSGVSARR